MTGGVRSALAHGEAMTGGQAHTTTPHLTGHGQVSPGPGGQYRGILPPQGEHEQRYSNASAETRPTVIESSQPLIIECT